MKIIPFHVNFYKFTALNVIFIKLVFVNCQEIICSAFGGTEKAENTNRGGDG